MKLIKGNVFFIIFLLLLLTFIIYMLELKWNVVGFSFLINLISICIYLFLSIKKEVTSALFVYIFILTFFVIFPWIQYTSEVVLWSNELFNDFDYLLINSCLFFLLFVYFLFYKIFSVARLPFFQSFDNVKKVNFKMAVFLCFSCFCIIFYSKGFNVENMLLRGGIDESSELVNSNPFVNVLVYFSRFFPVFIFLKFISLNKSDVFFKKMILFIFVLVCAFPLGIPRFMVAFIYFPILYYYISIFRKSYITFYVLLFSLVLVFPFLDQFRYFDIEKTIKFIPSTEYFLQAHFDAYQNFMEVLRKGYITYGIQLIGVMLFFVPRSMWPEKPVGSGYQMANDLGYVFNNISMPLFAEGYVNFGYIGMILFAIFLSFWCKVVDTKLLSISNSKNNNFSFFVGIFYCASIFFLMRGDMMSGFSYMLAGIVAYNVAKKV